MAKGRGKKGEARKNEGRGEASRRSRTMQGFPAEEHKDLDQLKRDRRAKMKFEQEARAAQAEGSAVEPATQGEQVSTRVECEDAEVLWEAEVGSVQRSGFRYVNLRRCLREAPRWLRLRRQFQQICRWARKEIHRRKWRVWIKS
jgi:hypothetical protein